MYISMKAIVLDGISGGWVLIKCFLMITAFLTAIIASNALAEDKVTGSAYIGPYNKYMYRGLDLSDNQWVIQGGVDLSYKNFTLSYWSNFQAHSSANSMKNNLTETDITLNYSFSPVELLSINVGNTFYSFDSPQFGDTNELYLKTTFNTPLSPSLTMYWDWGESTKTGLFYTFSIGHTKELTKEVYVSASALASYNMENPSASANYNNFHNYELSLGLDYSPIDKLKISPSYTYSNAFSSVARSNGVHDQNIYGIKAAFIF